MKKPQSESKKLTREDMKKKLSKKFSWSKTDIKADGSEAKKS